MNKKSHSLEAFTKAYATLNTAQRTAVDTIEGPVMVIAGPGTGKTQVLTLRIANILLKTDTAPESILALTFTKSGARAMRERLQHFVGSVAYQIPIHTFHGFCEALIQEYPEYYEHIIGSQPATDIERINFLESILEAPEIRRLRPVNAPDYYIPEIISIIGAMKQENISPDDLASIISNEEHALADIEQFHIKGAHKGKQRSEYTKAAEYIEKQKALLSVYREYDALMRAERRYDFDDMILETVRVLQTVEAVRLDVQERYQYVLADEHQDVNGAQNTILSLITSFHDSPNLFVVGDEKQSIYRFQGASLENFLYFEKQYPQTKVIALTENYRSTQHILDVAHELIKVKEGPLLDYRVPLVSKGDNKEGQIVLKQFAHEQFEHDSIVADVQSCMEKGVSPQEIAVIVRSNRDVELFTSLLRAAGIAVTPSAEGDILQHPICRSLLDLLTAIAEPTNDVALASVLQSPYCALALSDVITLTQAVRYNKSLSSIFFDTKSRASLSLEQPEQVAQFARTIEELRSLRTHEAPHRIVATALHDTHFLDFVITKDAREATRIVRRIYDEVEVLTINHVVHDLSSLVRLLHQRLRYRTPLNAPYVPDGLDSVQVLTSHKSKGLEFEVVFIPHVTDSAWSGKRRRDLFHIPLVKTAELALEANEDERRLMYVAMTRAKKELYLSLSTLSNEGSDMSASSFLFDIKHILPVEVVEPSVATNQFQVHAPLVPSNLVPIISRSLQERGLSVTALNNAIENPWNYFFRNVVRLPEIKTPALQYGTAMHSVMQFITTEHTRHGTVPSFSDTRSKLESALNRLPLSVTEYTSLFEKGVECIPVHLAHCEKYLPKQTKDELSIRVAFPDAIQGLPQLMLTGVLDRIDVSEQGDAERVVDYKTGKPKSRNQLEGNTKAGDLSYRRQLAFYALLLKLHDDERWYTPFGTLLFLEPDKQGKIKEETFESGVDVQDSLKAEISKTVTDLLTGNFLYDDDLLEKSDYAYVGRMWRDKLLKDHV